MTGGSHKGTGKQPQSRVTARSAKELERLGARTWIEVTRNGTFRFAKWENITYYCTARGDNAYDVAKGPWGLVENVETATGNGTAKADSPRDGGEGGGMAENSPNRFVWHEGEVEGISEEDKIPREWPAYRRAYAALC